MFASTRSALLAYFMHNVFKVFFLYFIYYNKQRYNGYAPLGVNLLLVQILWTAPWPIGGCVGKWWVHKILKPFSEGKIHAPWT
jgi:hypothetical protein